ncbi:hypothetical protein BD779DRAFT_1674821 [Infundibulicybe gibba]|nr:hypothetical protein BD779DRAFT_1674821 [Infundibulicybe gibba]
MSTRITRPSNKTSHPGLVDLDDKVQQRSRRDPAETKANKIAEAEVKQQVAAKKAAALQVAGVLEAEMAKVDRQNELNAARPRPKKITKISREKVVVPNEPADEREEEEQQRTDGLEDGKDVEPDRAGDKACHDMELDPKADDLDDEARHEMELDPKAGDEHLSDDEENSDSEGHPDNRSKYPGEDDEDEDEDDEGEDEDDEGEDEDEVYGNNEGYPGDDEAGATGFNDVEPAVSGIDMDDEPAVDEDDSDTEDRPAAKITKPNASRGRPKPKAKVPAALHKSPRSKQDTNTDLPEISESTTQHGKRKASTALAPSSFKKKKSALPSGLVQGWTPPVSQSHRPAKQAANIQTPRSRVGGQAAKSRPVQAPKSHSTQTAKSHSAQGSKSRQAKSAKPDSGSPSDDGYKYGGFVGSDEDDLQSEVNLLSPPPTRRPKKDERVDGSFLVKVNHQLSRASRLTSSNPSSTATTPSTKSKQSQKKFTNINLPKNSHVLWQKDFLPRWFHAIGISNTPWFTDVAAAQELWDLVFSKSKTIPPQALKPTGEAIFCVLKQRTYEWRHQFAFHAAYAVEAFWKTDPAYKSSAGRAAYVKWAIPTNTDDPIPLIWSHVDERNPKKIGYKGKFLTTPIIYTFAAHHLIVTSTVSLDCRGPNMSVGALAMAATAVERAFMAWATGDFVYQRKENFSSAWASKTALYIDELGAVKKGWIKIEAAAKAVLDKLIRERPSRPKPPSTPPPKLPTPRSQAVDADEMSDGGTSN